jgi:hypothetical protein
MATTYTLTLDQDQIRFTPKGQIAVVDAISALIGSEYAQTIWVRLIEANPEVREYCDDYQFRNAQPTMMVDADGWQKIETLLFEYLVNTAA